jgi:hypothetical protein
MSGGRSGSCSGTARSNSALRQDPEESSPPRECSSTNSRQLSSHNVTAHIHHRALIQPPESPAWCLSFPTTSFGLLKKPSFCLLQHLRFYINPTSTSNPVLRTSQPCPHHQNPPQPHTPLSSNPAKRATAPRTPSRTPPPPPPSRNASLAPFYATRTTRRASGGTKLASCWRAWRC